MRQILSSITRPIVSDYLTTDKYHIREVPFVKHEVSEFQDVFMHTLNGIPRCHEVLIFILALKNSRKDLLNIIALMFGFANQNNSPSSMPI